MGLDMSKNCLEQSKLLRTADHRHQEHDAWMQLDLTIAAAELDRVIGDQHSILFGDDLQQIPIRLGAKAEVVDVHRFMPALACRLDRAGR